MKKIILITLISALIGCASYFKYPDKAPGNVYISNKVFSFEGIKPEKAEAIAIAFFQLKEDFNQRYPGLICRELSGRKRCKLSIKLGPTYDEYIQYSIDESGSTDYWLLIDVGNGQGGGSYRVFEICVDDRCTYQFHEFIWIRS